MKKLVNKLRYYYYYLIGRKSVPRNPPVVDIKEKLLILANGPSSKYISKDRYLHDYDWIVVNSYPIFNNDFFDFKPKYLCLVDPSFFYPKCEEEKIKNQKLVDVLEKVNWNLTIITVDGWIFPVDNCFVQHHHLSRYVYNDINMLDKCYKLYNKNYALFGRQNVAVAALNFGICVGYKKIEMAGVDISDFTNYSVDIDNNIIKTDIHDYGTDVINFTELGIVKKGEFYKVLMDYEKTFFQFFVAQHYANKKNVSVINKSVNSYVDVFKKNGE